MEEQHVQNRAIGMTVVKEVRVDWATVSNSGGSGRYCVVTPGYDGKAHPLVRNLSHQMATRIANGLNESLAGMIERGELTVIPEHDPDDDCGDPQCHQCST